MWFGFRTVFVTHCRPVGYSVTTSCGSGRRGSSSPATIQLSQLFKDEMDGLGAATLRHRATALHIREFCKLLERGPENLSATPEAEEIGA
ncbi:MAG TPA: hypothetical protein VN706_10625 [Gemmatimonadaceae bacterium]|nr:hypothetical protein [Gemmatimonadaceae bacterium]